MTVQVTIDTTVSHGEAEEVPVFVTLSCEVSHDPNYNSDADGRRGCDAWFLDEWEIVSWEPPEIPHSLISNEMERMEEEIQDKAIDKAQNDKYEDMDPDEAWDSRHDD